MTAKIVVGSTTLPEKAGYCAFGSGLKHQRKSLFRTARGRSAMAVGRPFMRPVLDIRHVVARSPDRVAATPPVRVGEVPHARTHPVEPRGGSGSHIPGPGMAIAGRLDSHFPMKYRAGAASARLLWDEAPATVILGRPKSVRLQQWAGGMPEGGEETVGSGRSAVERGRPQDHLGGRGYHGLTGFGASAGRNDIVNSSCAPIGECYSLAKTPVDRANWSSSMAKDISTDDVGSLASGFGQSASRFIGG